MSLEQAHDYMITQQLQPYGITNPHLLSVIHRSNRADFVPEAYRGVSYSDSTLPLPGATSMLPPKLLARLLEALEIHSTDKVLQVGAGSGYVTHLLAQLSFHVFAVEIHPELSALAKQNLGLQCQNVDVITGNGAMGWSQHAPYDVILVTAAYPTFPRVLLEQLAPRGRLCVTVGEACNQTVYLSQRCSAETFKTTALFETQLPYLFDLPVSDSFTL